MDPQKERELMKTELCGGSDSCLVSMEDVKIEISSRLFFHEICKAIVKHEGEAGRAILCCSQWGLLDGWLGCGQMGG